VPGRPSAQAAHDIEFQTADNELSHVLSAIALGGFTGKVWCSAQSGWVGPPSFRRDAGGPHETGCLSAADSYTFSPGTPH